MGGRARKGTITRRFLLQGGTAAGAALALGKVAGCSKDDPEPPPNRRPNVIVVLADDMRYDELPFLPNVTSLLVDEGVSFSAARHNISLCSPARAGFLTGQYSMRHQVRSQADAFAAANNQHKTVAVWMQDAGYTTGLIGKYFTGGNRFAPGWDTKRQLAENPQNQEGFTVWDGAQETTPSVDQTRYLSDEVTLFLESAPEPFFLWFTPTANHWPIEPPPGHEDDVASLEWPDDSEEDVSDKPPWIQSLPPVGEEHLRMARAYQRGRVRELLGLDDTIGSMVQALKDRGSLDNTVVMFSSDNGVFAGEHRLPLLSKNMPYDPSVRVPCLIRAPGLAAGVVTQPAHMAIDLTATCVAVADAHPDLELDGTSLLEIAGNPSRYDERGLLYDRDDRDNGTAFDCPPAAGVFTATRKLIRYETTPPTFELYDLEHDPDELTNVADDPAYTSQRTALEAELDGLLSS